MSKRPVNRPTARTAVLAVLALSAVLAGLTVTAGPAAPATSPEAPHALAAVRQPGPSATGPVFGTPGPRERARPTGRLFPRAAAPEATVAGGDITIVLDAQPDSAQDVGFTGCSAGGCGPFLLDDDADATHPRQLSGTGLAPGTYQVTQQAVPGWTLTAVECDTGETVDLGARRVAIDLSDGEHATCTFTVAAAAITVVLDAQPDSGADVGFTGCGALGCGPFTLDDDADPAHQARLTAAGLADGTYTITQAALPGRFLTRLTCTPGASVDYVQRRATITLVGSQQVTCTFVIEPAPALDVTTVVSDLAIPWDLAWTPDGAMLWTERAGSLHVLTPGGTPREVTLAGNGDFHAAGEIGLMGLAVDPAFAANRRIYTCQGARVSGVTSIKVVVWSLDAGITQATRVVDPLVGGIPLGQFHGGCRLEFGPDGQLLVTTGDATIGTAPQDLGSLAGKVLRVDPATGAGSPANVFAADGDPATDARIFTSGHRNVQGLAVRPGLGQIWAVEHGPDRDDEVNLLTNGGNYGWDPVPGYDQSVPMTDLAIPGAVPASWSSGQPTVATSGAVFLTGSAWQGYEGTLAVATLKNSRLQLMGFDHLGRFILLETPAALAGTFGRLRTPAMGPDGALYVTTSNGSEDRILRVAPT